MKIKNKLIFQLFLSLLISFGAAMVVLTVLSYILVQIFSIQPMMEQGVYLYNALMLLVILTFVVVFLLLVRNKIVYLNRISDQVQQIAGGALNERIDEEGSNELTRLARNINTMTAELERRFEYEREIERTKNELITAISHDLRTPLTSVIGYLDLVRKKQYRNEQELQEFLETAYAKSGRLHVLLNELFDYTKLSSPDVLLQRNELDLTAVLEQLIGEFVPMFENNGMTIRSTLPDEPITVSIDVEKMIRVYENVLMNALIHGDKPSAVSAALRKEQHTVTFSLTNKAPRPNVNDLDQLFERFVTSDTARKNQQGTGLGLAIAKRIVTLHDGTIHATYHNDELTLTIVLPIG